MCSMGAVPILEIRSGRKGLHTCFSTDMVSVVEYSWPKKLVIYTASMANQSLCKALIGNGKPGRIQAVICVSSHVFTPTA